MNIKDDKRMQAGNKLNQIETSEISQCKIVELKEEHRC